MENLTREGLKALGVTDEAIDEILKTRGNEINKAEEQRNQMKKALDEAMAKAGKVDELSKKLDELEKKNMTAEELQAQRIKEAEEAKRNYTILSNKTEAKDVLIKAGMVAGDTLDRIINKISSEDLTSTLEAANLVAQMYNTTKTETEQRVKSELLANNPKPNPTNLPENDGKVTKEQIKAIAEYKMPDLNANDIEAAMKIIEGSAKSMGLEVVE